MIESIEFSKEYDGTRLPPIKRSLLHARRLAANGQHDAAYSCVSNAVQVQQQAMARLAATAGHNDIHKACIWNNRELERAGYAKDSCCCPRCAIKYLPDPLA